MQEQEKQAVVPYFVHEGDMVKMGMALRTVCITLVLVVILFVTGYTINNNNWLRYVEKLQTSQTEVADAGIHQQSDQGTD